MAAELQEGEEDGEVSAVEMRWNWEEYCFLLTLKLVLRKPRSGFEILELGTLRIEEKKAGEAAMVEIKKILFGGFVRVVVVCRVRYFF